MNGHVKHLLTASCVDCGLMEYSWPFALCPGTPTEISKGLPGLAPQILPMGYAGQIYNMQLDPGVQKLPPSTKCECGAEACGFSTHAHYCPKKEK